MSETDSKKCFISSDGTTTEGPIGLSELKARNQSGKLPDGVLCSVINDLGSYHLWRPIALHTRERKAIDSRSKTVNRMADILRLYVGWFVGANVTDPKGLDVVLLKGVGDDHFSISPRGSQNTVHYLYSQTLSLCETATNIECKILKPIDRTIKQGTLSKIFVGNVNQLPPDWVKVQIEVPLLIEVNHLIVYKGSTSVGVSVPISQ